MGQRAAEKGDPLGQADQAPPRARTRRHGFVADRVGQPDLEVCTGSDRHLHPDRPAGRVPAGIGQTLLHHAVRRPPDRRGHGRVVDGADQLDWHTHGPALLHEGGQVREGRLRPGRGRVTVVLVPQHQDHLAQLVERLVHAGPDHAGRRSECARETSRGGTPGRRRASPPARAVCVSTSCISRRRSGGVRACGPRPPAGPGWPPPAEPAPGATTAAPAGPARRHPTHEQAVGDDHQHRPPHEGQALHLHWPRRKHQVAPDADGGHGDGGAEATMLRHPEDRARGGRRRDGRQGGHQTEGEIALRWTGRRDQERDAEQPGEQLSPRRGPAPCPSRVGHPDLKVSSWSTSSRIRATASTVVGGGRARGPGRRRAPGETRWTGSRPARPKSEAPRPIASSNAACERLSPRPAGPPPGRLGAARSGLREGRRRRIRRADLHRRPLA